MDDYTSNVLSDSKNEWSILLINYITPHIIDGFRSIFNESVRLCQENDEIEKYLMTYQNLLARIPKWNQTMIKDEHERIVKLCNCTYLEDILTCVHIVQLKILSCVRVGSETKKVKIDIPEFSTFLHQVYINIARKLYSSIYLFEIDIAPLEQQKRNREFELIVQTCIMNTIRDRIPIETLLRQYIDETQEIEIIKEEKVLEPKIIENRMAENKMAEFKPNVPDFEIKTKEKMDINDNFNELNKMPEPHKVGFAEKNSVLTFETEKEIEIENDSDSLKIGEKVPLNNFDFEDLESEMDLSKKGDKVDLVFEEL